MQTESDEEREQRPPTELFDVDSNEDAPQKADNGRTLSSPFNEALPTPKEKPPQPIAPLKNTPVSPLKMPKHQQSILAEGSESQEEELSEESDEEYFDSDCADDDDDDDDEDDDEEKELTQANPQQEMGNAPQNCLLSQQSLFPSATDKGNYWNTRYQQILLLPKTTDREKLRRAVELKKLYDEFDESAIRIAKELVVENESPIKKHPPVSTNGIAGGQSK